MVFEIIKYQILCFCYYLAQNLKITFYLRNSFFHDYLHSFIFQIDYYRPLGFINFKNLLALNSFNLDFNNKYD